MGDKRFLLFSSYLLCTSNRGTSKPKWERGRASGPSLAARGAVCLRVGSLLLQHRHFLHGDCGLFGIRYALDLNVVSLVSATVAGFETVRIFLSSSVTKT